MAKHLLLLSLLTTTTANPSWHRFATNKNYRLTAILDINGGSSQNSASPGYSVPLEVLTLYNSDNAKYHQRISYYSGTYVEYNIDGSTYAVLNTPFGSSYDVDGDRICFRDGGNETDKVDYLNFFPTVEQMESYSVGELITNEVSWF